MQPVAGSQLSDVQSFVSSQETGAPAWHAPPPQRSPEVHALPSSHGPALLVKTQPWAASQPSVVHGLLSLQTTGGPGLHVPPPQVSPLVQGLSASHGFVLFANTHPVVGLQLSVVQKLLSLHGMGAPG
jgi:hypothetical protein